MLALYLISKPTINLQEIVLQAILGGVSIVQLRDKECSDQVMIDQAISLQQILPNNVPLIINDRLRVAKHVGAGLHVGMSDVCPVEARHQLGDDVIIGLTIHDRVELAEQYQHVIDYVGVGPIFTTKTKKDAKNPLGVKALASIVHRCPVSVVAIGGITANSVAEVRATGVSGVAVCSAIMDAHEPLLAVKELL